MCGRLPVGKGFSEVMHGWSVLPCVRPVDAALFAWPLAIMLSARSGPGQKHAVKAAVARAGCPDLRVDRLGALSLYCPFQLRERALSARVSQAACGTGSL